MEDPFESGFARPVAPAWQPMMWFGAEVLPVGALIIIGFVVLSLVPSFLVKLAVIGVCGVVLGLLRYLGQIDDRYFASTMGFPDRGEYIASATVRELERDANGKLFGLL